MSDVWDGDRDRIAINDTVMPERHQQRLLTDWAKGYAAALNDVRHLAISRSIISGPLDDLIDDLTQDARVIDHEVINRTQRLMLRAKREAQEELPL